MGRLIATLHREFRFRAKRNGEYAPRAPLDDADRARIHSIGSEQVMGQAWVDEKREIMLALRCGVLYLGLLEGLVDEGGFVSEGDGWCHAFLE